jgi:hypothetical protein
VPAGLDPLRDDVVAAGLLGSHGLGDVAHLPSREGAAAVSRLHHVRARIVVEELDDSEPARRLGDVLKGRLERHQEVDPAGAVGGLSADRHHPHAAGADHGGRQLGRSDAAHGGKLER